jgi:hypothetical protein
MKAIIGDEQSFGFWSSGLGQFLPVTTGRFMAMNITE